MKKFLLLICICFTFNANFAQTKSIYLTPIKTERQKTDGKERRSPMKFPTPLLTLYNNVYILSNIDENACILFEIWGKDELLYSIQQLSLSREVVIQVPPMLNTREPHYFITINNKTYTNY